MRIPKKGELSKRLYRKKYTGFINHMTDEPKYYLVEAESMNPDDLKIPKKEKLK